MQVEKPELNQNKLKDTFLFHWSLTWREGNAIRGKEWNSEHEGCQQAAGAPRAIKPFREKKSNVHDKKTHIPGLEGPKAASSWCEGSSEGLVGTRGLFLSWCFASPLHLLLSS